MTITELRVKLMRDMDNYVRENVEDEDLFTYWLQIGVPDEADDEMLLQFAEIESCWMNIINAFAYICREIGIIERD